MHAQMTRLSKSKYRADEFVTQVDASRVLISLVHTRNEDTHAFDT
jgi:hypothetical protein